LIGKIAAVQVGREARIPVTEVERLLGQQRAGVIVLYGRVSGHEQKEDLQRQVQQLEQWALVARTGVRSRRQKALVACAKQALAEQEA
jgi:putative resolvase